MKKNDISKEIAYINGNQFELIKNGEMKGCTHVYWNKNNKSGECYVIDCTGNTPKIETYKTEEILHEAYKREIS